MHCCSKTLLSSVMLDFDTYDDEKLTGSKVKLKYYLVGCEVKDKVAE